MSLQSATIVVVVIADETLPDSEKMHQANAYGFTVPESATKIDWPTIKRKRDAYIERLNGIYERSAF